MRLGRKYAKRNRGNFDTNRGRRRRKDGDSDCNKELSKYRETIRNALETPTMFY